MIKTPKAEAQEIPIETVDIGALADWEAQKYHLNNALFRRVINCESRWNIKAVGDNGTSFGLAQIHLSAHPEITKEQAEDPAFALDWMAHMWSQGQERQWSCYGIVTASL